MVVNIVLSVALLLVIFNIHFGIIVAKRYHSFFGIINWSMALVLLISVIQKICDMNSF